MILNKYSPMRVLCKTVGISMQSMRDEAWHYLDSLCCSALPHSQNESSLSPGHLVLEASVVEVPTETQHENSPSFIQSTRSSLIQPSEPAGSCSAASAGEHLGRAGSSREGPSILHMEGQNSCVCSEGKIVLGGICLALEARPLRR